TRPMVSSSPSAAKGAMIWNPDVEAMARPEREALQLTRLRAAVGRARRVPVYRDRLAEAGAHPEAPPPPARPPNPPLPAEGRLPRAVPLRASGRAAGRGRPNPRLVGHTRHADGGRLHEGRPPRLARGDGALARRRRGPAGGLAPERLRLRPLHRWPRLPRRRRGDGALRRAGLVGEHAAPDPPLARSAPAGPRLHAVVRPPHRGEPPRAGDRRADPRAPLRPLRRGAVERGAPPPHRGPPRSPSRRLLRALRDHRTRGGRRVRGNAAGPPRERGPLPPRGRRPPGPAGAARGRARAGP